MSYIIGIVGIKGRMGSLFNQLFTSSGLQVLGFDLDANESLKEFIKKPDILLLSVPIHEVTPLIEKIAPHLSQNQLVADITSIKQQPCKAMKALEAEAVGLHPLFGPTIENPHGYPIACCPIRKGKITAHFLSYLQELGFHLLMTTPEKHDQMMGYVQCLPHFISMSFTRFLKESPFSEQELLEYAPPFFKLVFFSMIRIFAQSGTLYTDIQANNLYFKDILSEYIKTQEKTKKMLLHSEKTYQNLFEELQLFLGNSIPSAKKYTDSFIQQMKENQ